MCFIHQSSHMTRKRVRMPGYLSLISANVAIMSIGMAKANRKDDAEEYFDDALSLEFF